MALKVKIHRDSRRIVTSKQMDSIQAAIHFSLEYHDLYEHNHTVEVYLVNEIDPGKKLTTLGQHHLVQHNLSKIVVAVSDRWISNVLQTLFHEFTHLKHYLKHDIEYNTTPTVDKTWHGQPYPATPTTHAQYLRLPDERDARQQAAKMFRKWRREHATKWIIDLLDRIKAKFRAKAATADQNYNEDVAADVQQRSNDTDRQSK